MRMSEGLQSLLGSRVLAQVSAQDVSLDNIEDTFKSAAKQVAAFYETQPRAPMRKAQTRFVAAIIAQQESGEVTAREAALIAKLARKFGDLVAAYDPTEEQITTALETAQAEMLEDGLAVK